MTHVDHVSIHPAYIPISPMKTYYFISTFSSYFRAENNPGHPMWLTTPHLEEKCCVCTDASHFSSRVSTDMPLSKFMEVYRLVVKCST